MVLARAPRSCRSRRRGGCACSPYFPRRVVARSPRFRLLRKRDFPR
jgi:hypothetical protein